MLQTDKTYWKGVEELEKTPEYVKNAKSEFPDYLPVSENGEEGGTFRRDFLKMMGFGVAAATLAACETPVRKAIPYLNKPEDVDPTIPNWYASTYIDGSEYASIVVKTREGRPIKIEGNKNSSVTAGGLSARVQASVLSLYDKERYRTPLIAGKAVTWSDIDKEIGQKLTEITAAGQSIRIVTNTILSPSLKAAIAAFIAKYPTTKLITYDPNSASGIREANKKSFGIEALPAYDFSKADIVVGVSADFLGTWIAPTEYANQYAKNRKLGKDKKTLSRHYQFESILSLTGSNADFRSAIKPSQEGLVVAALYNAIAAKAGSTVVDVAPVKDVKFIEKAAEDLWVSRGKSLVVSGSNDSNVQLLVNAINHLLGNYGKTLDLTNPVNYKQGSDAEIESFIETANNGSIAAVIFLGSNPVYNYSKGSVLKEVLSKIPVRISTSDRPDETSALANYIAPDNHYLESWSDAEPRKGFYSLGQPAISPLFKTRQVIETFLTWSGNPTEAYTFVKNNWKSVVYPQSKTGLSFQSFWDRSLHDGVFEVYGKSNAEATAKEDSTSAEKLQIPSIPSGSLTFSASVSDVVAPISEKYKAASSELEYVVYEKVSIGTGSQSNNPWLQELPEPVSKACWDNYFSVSQKFAKEKGLEQGDVIKIQTAEGKVLELPVLVQPGQAYNTVAIAIGYGREVSGKVANGVGKNAYPLLTFTTSGILNFGIVKGFEKTGNKAEIAQTQTHHTMMARPIVQETTLSKYLKNPNDGKDEPKIKTSEGEKNPADITIWNTKGLQTHNYNNHFWGLVIDLNSCTGCSACVIGCQAENNVPVVGKKEVLNRREMHWIRIDRYYSTDAEESDLKGLEEPAENPMVVFQPVMCQHCNNAPCETVCPVLATTHSTEGLNQMTYNRCVGTRYCANNCPYKVRRFNWFSYYTNKERGFHEINPAHDARENEGLGKMVLNPDVTVRARGVMEKCSMCVQRIQAGKLVAKMDNRRPVDGEIETACSQSCPTEALVFGDMNDPESRISKLLSEEKEGRFYHLLEEINVKPSVGYLTKVRNV